MIKTIKKIDLNGNETWQEVMQCNRCKKILEPTNWVYEIEWTAWHPVKMQPGHAYGFSQGSNSIKHICEKCHEDVESFLNGKPLKNNIHASLEDESTETLQKMRNSYMCGVGTAKVIDIILKARGVE